MSANPGINCRQYPANPPNFCTSFLSLGRGHSDTLSIFSSCGTILPLPTLKPRLLHFSYFTLNWIYSQCGLSQFSQHCSQVFQLFFSRLTKYHNAVYIIGCIFFHWTQRMVHQSLKCRCCSMKAEWHMGELVQTTGLTEAVFFLTRLLHGDLPIALREI